MGWNKSKFIEWLKHRIKVLCYRVASAMDSYTIQLWQSKLHNAQQPPTCWNPLCNYCDAAKRLLTRNNATYNEINIAVTDGAMDEMIKKANGKRTIPQIFFDDVHIGGYDEVRALEKENKLQGLLK